MAFDSIAFVLFLPLVFLTYWTLHNYRKWQNVLLLAASYVFYGWWDWRFLGLILLTTCSAYICALWVERWRLLGLSKRAKAANAANCVLNLGVLGLFKYHDFFATSFNCMMEQLGLTADWPLLHLVLPVGISFYTFQALSYTIDVYRGDVRAERDWIGFATYIAFFPQLVAGPIERAHRMLPQFAAPRSFSSREAVEGCRQMLWGFVKKVVVADNCAPIVEQIFADPQSSGGSALLYGTVLFAFQIYADFSGYSDIAIGAARLFGIRLSTNFDNPYFATSIPDFWHRWHISLTSWFRDYVYIPLGGSWKGRGRTLANTVAVFSLSGLWHGANWTFVLWGFYHGLLFLPWCMGWLKRTKGPDTRSFFERVPSMLLTFLLVCIGWVFFRAESISMAGTSLWRIVSHMDLSFMQYSKSIVVFIALMLAAEWWHLPWPRRRWMRWAIYYLLIGLMLWKATASTQFIYFQF
ncbi:MAG: MBOAT family protein [Bacteroidales bacterium]|nr:MBOAT family protein [Bacteroidales bacterium]